MNYIQYYQSPLGGITMASHGVALTGLWFDGQKYYMEGMKAPWEEKTLPVFDEAVRWLDLYFSGKNPGFLPPLALQTTKFRKTVWEILLTIPFGQTRTYGQIAQQTAGRLGLARMSAQAVGGAIGHNAISLMIPCHRVIGANGALTGYAGGLDKKQKLLELEGADPAGRL
ncbi:MAG: methylated-DNA--[Parasporobacterium sp.]|nr:methylated-DNA--[protein]-cysteine S-methyltransferase [Parasporobacterium sp.]